MIMLNDGGQRWWNKPLVKYRGRLVPAELAILAIELRAEESGLWLNSRGTKSGVVDLLCSKQGKYQTSRLPLPAFVAIFIERMYRAANVKKGCPDLVIWNAKTERIRFVEVKCPHWDRPSAEQKKFISAAESEGIAAKIVEWEFASRGD